MRALRYVDVAIWFALRDTGDDPGNLDSNFGLLRARRRRQAGLRRVPLHGRRADAGATGAMGARVAVVVPCFNDGALIREALRSVREDEPVELVVVDDASTDPATLEVLDGLRAEGVRVIRHEVNQHLLGGAHDRPGRDVGALRLSRSTPTTGASRGARPRWPTGSTPCPDAAVVARRLRGVRHAATLLRAVPDELDPFRDRVLATSTPSPRCSAAALLGGRTAGGRRCAGLRGLGPVDVARRGRHADGAPRRGAPQSTAAGCTATRMLTAAKRKHRGSTAS